MARVVDYKFGKLVSMVNNSNGEPYDDWRMKYLDWPGLLVVGESMKNHPGKQYIYLYPNDPDSEKQPYFCTSCGDIAEDSQFMTIETENSTYTYEIGDFGLTQAEKEALIMNAQQYGN